ncbi:MAG: hypothetical protein ACREFW_08985, partial [Rhizomicrobium sp.]
MRILVSCLQGLPDHPIPAYGQWRRYFKNGIEEAGHEFLEVEGVDWAEALVSTDPHRIAQWRADVWERTLGFVRRQHHRLSIHLFLSYLYPPQVDAGAIRQIQSLGIPCVNFFCDNVREFRTAPREFRVFDLNWVPEVEALPMYRKAGLPHLCLPMPCWVPQEYRLPSAEETEPPTFIGRGDILRRNLFARALLAGADFQICGPGWDDRGQPASPAKRRLSVIVANQLIQVKRHGLA